MLNADTYHGNIDIIYSVLRSATEIILYIISDVVENLQHIYDQFHRAVWLKFYGNIWFASQEIPYFIAPNSFKNNEIYFGAYKCQKIIYKMCVWIKYSSIKPVNSL